MADKIKISYKFRLDIINTINYHNNCISTQYEWVLIIKDNNFNILKIY